MSDKANTKHGNMVALGPFTAAITAANLADPLDQYGIRWYVGGSNSAWYSVTVPMAGHIIGLSHAGDYPAAGVWSIAVVKNSSVLNATRMSVTSGASYATANSANAIAFAAGDSLGVSVTTDGSFAATENGDSAVFMFVIFDNA